MLPSRRASAHSGARPAPNTVDASASTPSSLGDELRGCDAGGRVVPIGDAAGPGLERAQPTHRVNRPKGESELAGHEQRGGAEDDDVVAPAELEGRVPGEGREGRRRGRGPDGLR